MDCNSSYVLREDWSRGALRLDAVEADLPFDEYLRGETQPAGPVVFRRSAGRNALDLVGTTYGTLYLASGKFVETLRQHEFTGWNTFAVSVPSMPELVGYVGLAVTGRSGPIDDALSERVMQEPLAPGGTAVPGLRGWCFDPESWDGSDVFMPEGTHAHCVTAGVRQALLDAGVTGCALELMSEMVSDVFE